MLKGIKKLLGKANCNLLPKPPILFTLFDAFLTTGFLRGEFQDFIERLFDGLNDGFVFKRNIP